MRYALIILFVAFAASQQVHAEQELRSSDTVISEVFAFEIRPEREKELSRYIDSLILTERQQRALELQIANQKPITTLICELSKYTPYRFKPEVHILPAELHEARFQPGRRRQASTRVAALGAALQRPAGAMRLHK